MANGEHVSRLAQGCDAWNTWRRKSEIATPDLTGADLPGVNLEWMNLLDVDFHGASLGNANLANTELSGANLTNTDLRKANLTRARIDLAYLDSANLANANLTGTILRGTSINKTDFTEARLSQTVFGDIDFSAAIGLETCNHVSSSFLDSSTLQKSGPLPQKFLRGVGLPNALIEYLPALFNQAIQHYSCFISYSTKDQDFADRLYADLQDKGVRCWFAPDDMPIGGKILDEIDSAIRLRDKLLLILSQHSIKSDWVEDEVTRAFEEEHRPGQIVLFPVRLDDAAMETKEAWAAKLRARHIGDFRQWKSHDAYKKSFERVLRDLTVKKP